LLPDSFGGVYAPNCLISGYPAAVISNPLAVDSLSPDTVALPGLTQLASCSAVGRTFSFVIHRYRLPVFDEKGCGCYADLFAGASTVWIHL